MSLQEVHTRCLECHWPSPNDERLHPEVEYEENYGQADNGGVSQVAVKIRGSCVIFESGGITTIVSVELEVEVG